MSDFQKAMHDFVQASNVAANRECHERTKSHQERCDRVLAQAGDVLESELRKMMRDESLGETDRLLSQTPPQVFERAFQRP